MVEQVRVNPEEVRGYGNICEEHTLEDFIVSSSGLAKEKENVHGTLTDVYKLVYSLYGFMFDFDMGNKQLYLQMGEADILSFGFDESSKQLYLLDEAGTGLSLGFDEDTNELYITDAPPIVHNYTLALDSESYTTSGSLSVSATLLDDGVAVSGATVSFTGGDSAVTATTNSSGVATATVNFTSSGTLTASYSNVSDTATVTVQTYLFYDGGVTGNVNTNYVKSHTGVTALVSSTGTTVSSTTYADCYYIANVLLPNDWIAEFTIVSVNAFGGIAFLNSSNAIQWSVEYNLNDSQKGLEWRVGSTTVLISNDYTMPSTIKLIKEGTSLEIYLNDTLISTKTITDITGYLGWKTHSHSSRSVTFKEFKVEAL